jgi:hypothetical protein
MNDVMDRYIGQSLKNWAAEQYPPASIKARVLLQASSGSPLKSIDDHIKNRLERSKKVSPNSQTYNQISDEQILESFAQSRLWLMGISPSFLRKLA